MQSGARQRRWTFRHQQITTTLGIASGSAGDGEADRLSLLLAEAESLVDADALGEWLELPLWLVLDEPEVLLL